LHKYLHIVCLDAPSPPTYGGAIDIFFKIKAFAALGIKINLHYFSYNPERGIAELESYCHVIYAYKRKSFWQSLLTPLPYTVASRINTELINKLNEDDHPVLLEGFHCSGLLPRLTSHSRQIVIRAHNDESGYYESLALVEKRLWRKLYYRRESRLLASYQLLLDKNARVAVLSKPDADTLSEHYGFRNVHPIPLFVPWDRVEALEGYGTYCLYHGNMAVAENEAATAWLIKNVFSVITVPLVIAGRGVSTRLLNLVSAYPHISVVHDPSQKDLSALITHAHVHVLPSFNKTGVKLKLLNALFNGRFCITNNAGAAGIGDNAGILVLEEGAAIQKSIKELMEQPFTQEDKRKRDPLLSSYNNRANAIGLSALLWKHCL